LAKKIYVPKTIGTPNIGKRSMIRIGGNGQTFYAFCLIKIATGYNVVLKAATGEQQNRNRKKSTERKCYIPPFKILEKIDSIKLR